MKGRSRVLAIIPARGGSKGISGKNLAEVGGVPLVKRAILMAFETESIDEIFLTTDDPAIADIGREAGLEVPALRPAHLATDHSSGFEVWRYAHTVTERRLGTKFEASVLLQPTNPFGLPTDVELCLNLVLSEGFEGATTVSRTPAHYSPEKTMVLGQSNRLEPYLSVEGFQATRQFIPDYYHLNGICYAARRETILDESPFFRHRIGAVTIDRNTVNIDDPHDLEVARWLWTRQ